MHTLSRQTFTTLAFVFVLAVSSLFATAPALAQQKGSLFINVTSEDPWKVSMAAFFGLNFALKQGQGPVVMFVNVQATPLFTRGKAAVRSEQFGKPVQDMVKEFQAAGGKVLICPVCMKALAIGEQDLMEGAQVASVQSVNEILFRPETKTLNW